MRNPIFHSLRSIYRGVKSTLNLIPIILTANKPTSLSWRDFIVIHFTHIRYQPLLLPHDEIIPKKAAESILDSRDKLAALNFPEDLTGKTVLDVGCAEGFFVIQAALRNARRAIGCDIVQSRLEIARMVAKSWQIKERVLFSQTDLYNIPSDWASDIVLCLSVAHHLHGGFHDTWRMISNPHTYKLYFDNMIRVVSTVSSLTKEVTYWEYTFYYLRERHDNVDHDALGRLWVQRGLYKKVYFVGLSQTLPMTDRAVYRAYK